MEMLLLSLLNITMVFTVDFFFNVTSDSSEIVTFLAGMGMTMLSRATSKNWRN